MTFSRFLFSIVLVNDLTYIWWSSEFSTIGSSFSILSLFCQEKKVEYVLFMWLTPSSYLPGPISLWSSFSVNELAWNSCWDTSKNESSPMLYFWLCCFLFSRILMSKTLFSSIICLGDTRLCWEDTVVLPCLCLVTVLPIIADWALGSTHLVEMSKNESLPSILVFCPTMPLNLGCLGKENLEEIS